MLDKVISLAAMGALALSLGACGAPSGANSASAGDQTSATEAVASSTDEASTAEPAAAEAIDSASQSAGAEEAASATQAAATTAAIGTVDNAFAEDEDALIATYAGAFEQREYVDADTGLSVTYNLYLPAGFDATQSYPMVVFIADMTSVGDDATRSLTQGRGALVWASEAWQSVHPTVVCVPTYPETIVDDHGSYQTTEYVELTRRLIETVAAENAVDTSRIYGTGQSMGCMTTLILAAEHPDLYAGCMFVDGQWDVNALKGLEGQRFVYFAAADDENASAGMSEVRAMFDADGVDYALAEWDGNWSPDELSSAANDLFSAGKDANFLSWASGTIDASSGGMGGGMGGSVAYHMASFDYAYRCVAVMEWLFQ